MRQRHLSWFFILLCQCLIASPCLAYGIGIITLPDNMQSDQQLMLRDPDRCLMHLEQQLRQTHLTQAKLDAQQLTHQIYLQQIAALCANMAQRYSRAQMHITTALELSKRLTSPSLQTRSYLILTQLLLKQPELVKKAPEALDLALKRSNDNHALPITLRFELALTSAQVALATNQLEQAKPELDKALQIAQQSHHPMLLGWAQIWQGIYYQKLNQSELALGHYTEAIRYASSKSDAAFYLRNHLHHAISLIYQRQKQWPKAIDYQQTAIRAAQQLQNTILQANSIAQLAHIYRKMHNYNMALVNYLNAQTLAEQVHNNLLSGKINYWLGQTYIAMDDSSRALAHLSLARYAFRNPLSINWLSKTLLSLAHLHLDNNETAIAILQLTKAEKLSESSSFKNIAAQVQQLLAKAYQQSGAYALALKHYQLFHQLSEQKKALPAPPKSNQLNNHYQVIEQQQQLNKLHETNQMLKVQSGDRRILIVILIMICLMLLSICMMTRLRLRRSMMHRRELTDQLYYHPRTGWPSLETAESPLTLLRQLNHYPMQQGFNPSSAHAIMLIRLCDEMSQNQLGGFEQRKQLETSFAHHIYHHLGKRFLACHLGGPNYLFIAPLKECSAEQLCMQLLDVISQFIQIRTLHQQVALGCCTTPFLVKAPDAIDDLGIVEIAHLALEAAINQTYKTLKHHWVLLQALHCSPAAFFQSQHIHDDIQEAVHKGLVKLSTNANKKDVIASFERSV
ncbi:tetratricopeptide repeat protein [Celerinatantimonas diazotrophica]|uniref:GGDEF domain-containing protein n=1 Tax=Celerinatantimonas diazotrophica TaxID=412034 RepID=A0A4R1J9S9_9GAMM|nr:hypothetical protein [Celerinatantimonas diazotrophica]TCK47270.1 hypothetical protein EV690_2979 [Celerinatantimonas diazotrophica]CAG9296042.1 hypothetical protein CEDIAZO_01181 [Celerinatantimonas diazotrophica]